MIMVAQPIGTGQAKETAFKETRNIYRKPGFERSLRWLCIAREFAKLHLADSRYYQTAGFGNSHYIL
jgi:hypothetical protein